MEQNLYVKTTEYISLLSLLHEIPVKPIKNDPTGPSSARRNVTYVLPFKKERILTNTLGFLSSIREDIDHIPAVCVAEERDANGLVVLLAVNKRTASGGNKILQEMERGFEQIFETISRALSDGGRRFAAYLFHRLLTVLINGGGR